MSRLPLRPVKDRPILMRGEMVRATLDDLKTQTRRVVKPQPLPGLGEAKPFRMAPDKCPYGKPGDRLWVRETWMPNHHPRPIVAYIYRATETNLAYHQGYKWKPSIFMPKKACRIWLEIVAVRVERLQEINNKDAKAEGCPHASPHRHGRDGIVREVSPGEIEPDPYAAKHNTGINDCWICMYRLLWESINGSGSWAKNPWVWVITFKRIKP